MGLDLLVSTGQSLTVTRGHMETVEKDDAFGDLGGILIWGPIGPKLGDPMCGFLGSHCMVWGYPY